MPPPLSHLDKGMKHHWPLSETTIGLKVVKFSKIYFHYMSKCGTSSHITRTVVVNQSIASSIESYRIMLATPCKYENLTCRTLI